MEYPENDLQFEEIKIVRVNVCETGYQIGREDGFSFWVAKESGVVPEVGQVARFYGDGIGRPVRGLFLNGVKVFYRTEAEFQEHHEIETYGKDAQDWLDRWDAGKTVWSISMGGLGPGYEQAIQIGAAEILRICLNEKFDASKWEDREHWAADLDVIDEKMKPVDEKLGFSGAQFGAARSIAAVLYRDGPRALMKVGVERSRFIQVSKNFPSL